MRDRANDLKKLRGNDQKRVIGNNMKRAKRHPRLRAIIS